MIPLRTIPPLNILYTILNNAGIVLNLDAELNHMGVGVVVVVGGGGGLSKNLVKPWA